VKDGLTQDAFLDGRLTILQPAKGYRAGVDPVLLAAAVPAISGQSVLDLGCGVGVASLCLGARVAGLKLTGIEVQREYADLARQNAAANDIALEVVTADLTAPPFALRQRRFDHVIANPPYHDRTTSTASVNPGRDTALGGKSFLSDWIGFASRRLAPSGHLTLIQRIERLPEILAALDGRLGSVVVRPLVARRNRAATLCLVQAKKGGRAAFQLSSALIMHDGDKHLAGTTDFSAELHEILRNAAELRVRC
jgi:tRNA1(Val) A37 N6-methylase TrmN6